MREISVQELHRRHAKGRVWVQSEEVDAVEDAVYVKLLDDSHIFTGAKTGNAPTKVNFSAAAYWALTQQNLASPDLFGL